MAKKLRKQNLSLTLTIGFGGIKKSAKEKEIYVFIWKVLLEFDDKSY